MMEERVIYIIFGSSGQYEDYTDWVHNCYLDKDIAEEIKDKLNGELDKIANNPKFLDDNYDISENDTDEESQLYYEWREAVDQQLYRIQESIIKDFYYTNRNESIDKLID
jgi:hypothetical protein